KQATAVLAEVKKFLSVFQGLKNRKPERVAVKADKFQIVQRAIVAELRRQKRELHLQRKLPPPMC
ncbi:hypothetical protein MO867_11560, partial [Microbulbifer sp. OS29]